MRQRLYEWHLKLARAFLMLTPQQNLALELWQEQCPQSGADEWPGWVAIIGERPKARPSIAFRRERTA